MFQSWEYREPYIIIHDTEFSVRYKNFKYPVFIYIFFSYPEDKIGRNLFRFFQYTEMTEVETINSHLEFAYRYFAYRYFSYSFDYISENPSNYLDEDKCLNYLDQVKKYINIH